MLRIVVSDEEYDEESNTFLQVDPVVLEMEHSLISLSKWESEFEKPFLGPGEKTPEEIFSYIKCMVLGDPVPEETFLRLSQENVAAINRYIDRKHSATIFNEFQRQPRGRSEVITSELIYYWLVAYHIEWEAQYWHLNRLFALIRICNIKNDPKQKKLPRQAVAQQYRDLNEQRKKQLGTRG